MKSRIVQSRIDVST